MPALPLHDPHREFHAGNVPVVRVECLDEHVAEIGVVDPGLDPLDEVLVVDIPVDLRLVLAREADDVHSPAAGRLRSHRRVVGGRRFQEPVGRHQDFELLRPRRVGTNDDGLVLRLFTAHRLLAAAAWRILALHPDPVRPRCRDAEVDGARVALDDEFRPGRIWRVRLPQRKVVTGTRVLDRVQHVGTHRLGRAGNDRACVLPESRRGAQRHEHCNRHTSVAHSRLLLQETPDRSTSRPDTSRRPVMNQ